MANIASSVHAYHDAGSHEKKADGVQGNGALDRGRRMKKVGLNAWWRRYNSNGLRGSGHLITCFVGFEIISSCLVVRKAASEQRKLAFLKTGKSGKHGLTSFGFILSDWHTRVSHSNKLLTW